MITKTATKNYNDDERSNENLMHADTADPRKRPLILFDTSQSAAHDVAVRYTCTVTSVEHHAGMQPLDKSNVSVLVTMTTNRIVHRRAEYSNSACVCLAYTASATGSIVRRTYTVPVTSCNPITMMIWMMMMMMIVMAMIVWMQLLKRFLSRDCPHLIINVLHGKASVWTAKTTGNGCQMHGSNVKILIYEIMEPCI
jgi:hypothetical protein